MKIKKTLLILINSSRCHEGNTALHYAVMQENVEACRILLEINPTLLNQTNYDGVSFFLAYNFISLKILHE